ncbi:MAG: DUF5915 domain-containing protein, partial [Candidatus Hydrothermarchaeaceae archaeon]
ESVHFEGWATWDESAIDTQLEKNMNLTRKYVEAEAAAREKSAIKRRWPVLKSYAVPIDKESGEAMENLREVIETATTTLSFEVKEPGWQIPEGHSTADFEFGTVALNTEKTEEVLARGYAREVVRRIQQMRKGANLDIEAFIKVNVEVKDEIANLLENQRDYISTETRAKILNMASNLEHEGTEKEWDINKNTFKISILNL